MNKTIGTKSSIHVSMDTEDLKLFTKISKTIHQSRNATINELIQEWIEDQQDILLAEKVLKDIKAGKRKTISHEEMMKELGW